jgi:uncharacterized protein
MWWPGQHDFNYGILDVTAHRPWPMPSSAWVMTQTWHDLLFAHWPVEIDQLRGRVPGTFPIDTFEGRAWIGIVPFHMSNVAPRGLPALPWVSAFPELNVRTYVTLDGNPGVYFFSLDAANPLAVQAARLLAHLPYYTASMAVEPAGSWIDYRSRRTASHTPPAELVCRYAPLGPPAAPIQGTLEYFLTERYCLYTQDASGRSYRLDIHHPRWPLQSADAEFSANTMAEAQGIRLPDLPPLLHFAKRQDMVAWLPRGV